jgi:hypothetical protein
MLAIAGLELLLGWMPFMEGMAMEPRLFIEAMSIPAMGSTWACR